MEEGIMEQVVKLLFDKGFDLLIEMYLLIAGICSLPVIVVGLFRYSFLLVSIPVSIKGNIIYIEGHDQIKCSLNYGLKIVA
jgi:hypothetical protein